MANRIEQEWDPEQAVTRPVEHRERTYLRPTPLIEAFGEIKPVSDWATDPRVTVGANVFQRRIQHGWPNESALTTPVASARAKQDGNALSYEAFGEEKPLREWAQDERCQVSEMTLRKNLQSGMTVEAALEYRRKPGRHFIGSHDEFTGEISDAKAALRMMTDGGELWVYDGSDLNRISLIHHDIRHTISRDLFQELSAQNLIAKNFETDTIKNFELTPQGRAAAR